MKVLHIANDFCGSTVHSQLFKRLDEQGIEQIIYNPIRRKCDEGKNYFHGKHTEIIYSYVIKPYHKYLYHLKNYVLFRDMCNKIEFNDINICHAATLFSDGGLAYELYKKYNIPYVVAVRNTDVNGFMRLLPHTWINGVKILLEAKKIFFISESLKEKFCKHVMIRPVLNKIREKIISIPNGIDDFYLDNIYYGINCTNKIIYIGDFSNNKNVVRLCNAVLRLRKEDDFNDTILTIVGGGKNSNNKVEQIIAAYPNAFNFVGKVYDKEKLCNLLRANSLFAMPSIHETFGLVYIEALSQNLPVIYTKGQGIDGLFDNKVGISVNPKSTKEIYSAIKNILCCRDKYFNTNIDFNRFRWDNIAEQYIRLYSDII